MKRIVTFLLIVTLVFSMSISAFALELSDGTIVPEIRSANGYTYSVIYFQENKYYLTNSLEPLFVKDNGKKLWQTSAYEQYGLTNNEWKWISKGQTGGVYLTSEQIFWANYDVYDENGELFYSNSVAPPECDGSSCPANDIEHDNICDDCGNVLTFSLRSTLLDYAKYQAEEFGPLAATHTYYAVVEHPTESDSYLVYVSEILMGSTNQGQTVTGGNMYVTKVLTMDNGAFANQGWTAIDSWSGKVVYANHTIPFFFRVPLTVSLQGPTGEQMEMEAPNLTKEFSTLALCGIGCLALLILLRLFRASLTNFLN